MKLMKYAGIATTALCIAGITYGADPAAKPLTLVKDGVPQCMIVVSNIPTKEAVFAAAELQWHIQQITGAKVPVVREPEAIKGLPIYIGESGKVRELGLKNHSFGDREFAVKFFPDAIVLTGSSTLEADRVPDGPLDLTRKVPELGANRGALFATYEFIENVLDVRWYAPGEQNISWPAKTNTLTVTPKDVRRTISIRDRNMPWTGGISAQAWGNPAPAREDLEMYRLRNKVAGGNIISHSFEGWPERFLQKDSPLFESYHPEYFSKDQGANQLCFTHTGTVAQIITDARRWADGKGATHRAHTGEDFYSVEPRDTSVACTCDTCKPLLGKRSSEFGNDEASVIVWGLADRVARALQETNPGKSAAALAYGNHAGCPTNLNLATNIYVAMAYGPRGMPIPGDGCYNMYKQWLAKLPGRMASIWLYPCFPRETASTQGYVSFPVLEARGLNAQMRMFADDKVRCFMICGQYDAVLDDWCLAKFQDNPFVDVEATIAEFFQRYYGPAAGPMKKLYDGIEAATAKNSCPDERTSWEVCGTDARMAEWQTWLDEAVAVAKNDPEKSRVANIRDNLWKEMLKGKKIWTHRAKNQADMEAFKKLPPLETNMVKLAKAPASGDAKDVDWKTVTPIKIFRILAGYPALERTADLYLAHDGKNIYVRLTDHVDPSKLVDQGQRWWFDRWEIFVTKQSDRKAGQTLDNRNKGEWGPYRQVGVRPNTATCDMGSNFIGEGDDGWTKTDLKLHQVKTADAWTFYLTFALDNVSSLGPVKPGEMVYFNFIGPNEYTGDVLALSPTLSPSQYHNVPRLAGFKLMK